MTFARFATVAVPLPPREPGPPPPAGVTTSTAGVSGRDTHLMPVYPVADRETALLPVCADDIGAAGRIGAPAGIDRLPGRPKVGDPA